MLSKRKSNFLNNNCKSPMNQSIGKLDHNSMFELSFIFREKKYRIDIVSLSKQFATMHLTVPQHYFT